MKIMMENYHKLNEEKKTNVEMNKLSYSSNG